MWMLFSNSNLTAGANGLTWGSQDWSLINHFIPFTEAEVQAKGRFESNFMSNYMTKLSLSREARAVLAEGGKLWRRYSATSFGRLIRDEYKLNRADAGWCQVRRSLEANAHNEVTDFAPFRTMYTALSEKLRPQVYELGFLVE